MHSEPARCCRTTTRSRRLAPCFSTLLLAAAVTACGAAAEKHPSLPTDVRNGPRAPEAAPPTESPAESAVQEGLRRGVPAPAAPGVVAPVENAAPLAAKAEDPELTAAKRMVDIEAH